MAKLRNRVKKRESNVLSLLEFNQQCTVEA